MDAIIAKYGFKEGLTTKGNKVINWPYSEPKPSDKDLLKIITDFNSKNSKLLELKQKRDDSNISNMTNHEGIELIPNELGFTEGNPVYFSFRTRPTGNPATEPTSILSNVVVKNIGLVAGDLPPSHYLPYSCDIIEGETKRKGYIKLDFVLAQSLVAHLEQKNSTNIKHCNNLEVQLDNATTTEEVEAINW